MKLEIPALKMNQKLQTFIGLSILLFGFKFFIASSDSTAYLLIDDILVGLTVITFVFYLKDWIHLKKVNPLSLVMNIGILSALIFLLITFSGAINSSLAINNSPNSLRTNFISNLATFIYSFIILGSLSYIFLAFRELYSFKQKRDIKTYFNTMVVFFILASYSTLLQPNADLLYIKDTFFIISILLIIINSIKISWIAFIVKREKKILLFLSIIIAILFVSNLVKISNQSPNMLGQFSPILNQFFKIIGIYGSIYFSILFFTTLFHIPTAEAFDRKAQEVTSLQYFSKLITEVLDFDDLVRTITDIAAKLSNADAAWIAWKEGDGLKSVGNNSIGFLDADLITLFVAENKEKYDLNETVFISLDRFRKKSQLGESFSNITVSPLRAHNELKGYLLTGKKNNFLFDDEDKNALDTFSDYASVAIENSRLFEESIIKERLEKELDLAREVQRKILPSKNPSYEGLTISTVFIPAFEVGGDYYDFFEIDEYKFGFVIADVSGKGISAAFIMAEVKGIFESLSKTIKTPKNILIKANEILQRTLDRKNFVSAAYGFIDVKNETMLISRAGHCPIILIRDNAIENLRPSGIGLGLNFSEHFSNTLEEIKIDLRENDIVVLYTDGITEAKNKLLEDFGSDLFEKILIENCDKDADDIANKVIREVTLFSQNHPQHDDITLVILKWKQKLKIDGEKEWQNLALQPKI
ncbi:MAG TPA: PP2C family protein-serine/threonine phosphatase [Ignavibacteriaceae bacterium]|nr:PP2C family protein-serine/threonine phosphatase [Ignavibacteriaceae bacterium]